jgi:hypothetical protein
MKLPDLDTYPSVLEFDQINEIYEIVLNQFDKAKQFGDTNKLATYLIEVIHSQGYRPDEGLRKDLDRRILEYLESWWDETNAELCESITILSANLNTPDALIFLEKKRKLLRTRKLKKISSV